MPCANHERSRRFFLAVSPGAGAPRLLPEDEAHAARVLRLERGDELVGMDGLGSLFPLRVEARARSGELRLEPAGEPWREPAPGEPGAPLPWIEIAFAPPRAGRAEDMVDRLVQLGAAALTPLLAERTQRGERALPRSRLARMERAAREACKQSRRAWMPVLAAPVEPLELPGLRPGAAIALLDPAAPLRLVDWAAAVATKWGGSSAGTRERPILLAVGPEGGFDERETAGLCAAGATAVCLGPHVLRIETACEAALACLAQVLFRPEAR